MNFLEKLQHKPREEKVRVIKVIVIVIVIVMLILWALTTRIKGSLPKDTTLFQTLGRGIKDFKENFRK